MAKKKTKGSKGKSKKASRKKKTAKKKAPKKKKSIKKKPAKKKRPAKKKISRKKPAKKSRTKSKPGAAKKKTAKKAGRSMAGTKPPRQRMVPMSAAPSAYIPAPNEMAVGKVTHYYSNLQVAVVELDRGALQVGDRIHLKGHTTDFEQAVDSMEVEHQRVDRAEPGEIFGLKVRDHAREHDVIYKIQS